MGDQLGGSRGAAGVRLPPDCVVGGHLAQSGLEPMLADLEVSVGVRRGVRRRGVRFRR
jgi:hypothetical protein